jgi:predicted alpha/beta superfamily hydrolase
MSGSFARDGITLRARMRIAIRYPLNTDRVVLRTSLDWDRDVLPIEEGAEHAVFEVDFAEVTLALKPCLLRAGGFHWSCGSNYVVSRHDPDPEIWPFFFAEQTGSVSEVMSFERDGLSHAVRVYLPPGYHENTLRHYPVLYMQDGRNLFVPHEAFGGHEWQVDETMDRLDRMNAVRKVIVVGVAPIDRMKDYTLPGYAAYGEFLTRIIKPAIDRSYRSRTGPADTVVMGSSLGGVVSLFLAWQLPDVFGAAACLSSTFGYQDDLFARIASEPCRAIRIYLDSGWPRDNFDATNAMRDLLVHRGYQLGVDLMQFSFPEGTHNENSWAERIHMPFQFFFGRAWVASRSGGSASARPQR